jgi:hypothetical protein
LRPYLLIFGADGQPTGLHAVRYEFWLSRQIRKRFQSGEIYLDDSLQHRHFSDELVSMNEKADTLAQMDIPFLQQLIDAQLDALAAELHTQWLAFNRELKQGKLTHLEYDKGTQKLTWRKLKSYLRQATLHAANDCISNAIAALPIFPYYSFDLDALYGAVDGQNSASNDRP